MDIDKVINTIQRVFLQKPVLLFSVGVGAWFFAPDYWKFIGAMLMVTAAGLLLQNYFDQRKRKQEILKKLEDLNRNEKEILSPMLHGNSQTKQFQRASPIKRTRGDNWFTLDATFKGLQVKNLVNCSSNEAHAILTIKDDVWAVMKKNTKLFLEQK